MTYAGLLLMAIMIAGSVGVAMFFLVQLYLKWRQRREGMKILIQRLRME